MWCRWEKLTARQYNYSNLSLNCSSTQHGADSLLQIQLLWDLFFSFETISDSFWSSKWKKIKEICFSGVLIAEECLDATKYKTEYNSILVLFIFKENEISFAALKKNGIPCRFWRDGINLFP